MLLEPNDVCDDTAVTSRPVSDAEIDAANEDMMDAMRNDAAPTEQELIDMERAMRAENAAEHGDCGWMSDAELDRAYWRFPHGYGLGLACEYHATHANPYRPYTHDYKSPTSRRYLGGFPTHVTAVAAGVAAARKMVAARLREVRAVNPADVPARSRTLRTRQPWRFEAAA
jgi:hypothetical protein